MEIWLHTFLILILDVYELLASLRGHFTAEEIDSGTNWMGSWKEFRVGQTVLEKRKWKLLSVWW